MVEDKEGVKGQVVQEKEEIRNYLVIISYPCYNTYACFHMTCA